MARKTQDPVLISMLDQRGKLAADCERWYGRLKRAFTALEKCRRRLRRIGKRIEQHERKGTSCT